MEPARGIANPEKSNCLLAMVPAWPPGAAVLIRRKRVRDRCRPATYGRAQANRACPPAFSASTRGWEIALVGGGWCFGLEGVVPLPLGAFAAGPAVGRDLGWGAGRWSGQGAGVQQVSVAVGDPQMLGVTGDGDLPAVVQAVVIRAEQDQVGYKSLIYLLLACILPVWRW